MLRIKNIATGWGKTMGLLPVNQAEKALQHQRLDKCQECPLAASSKVLRIINGSATRVETLYCTSCGCPCAQKAIVMAEKCPVGKW